MNQKARDALIAAGLAGRPQARMAYHSPLGDCALGILHELSPEHRVNKTLHTCIGQGSLEQMGLGLNVYLCPVPGCISRDLMPEVILVTHLNDCHLWDFLTIARQFPEESNLGLRAI